MAKRLATRVCVLAAVFLLLSPPFGRALATLSAQALSASEAVANLSSSEFNVRLRAVQWLKTAAAPETAVPLAAAILDSGDEVQLEAIGAELNIFLADKITPKKRVGFLLEVRGVISAEGLFTAGPSVVGALRVPLAVPTALATATSDKNPRVAVEALYALGVLGPEVVRADRPMLLRQSGPLLAGILGSPYPMLRLGAARVIGQLWMRRPGDPPLDERVGDAVITALNDKEGPIREAAMWALGSMKYERSVQSLTDLFQYHRKGPLAQGSFAALAQIGHAATLQEFVTQLHAPSEFFRMTAIEGLARGGDRSSVEAIHTLLATERSERVMLAGDFANVLLADGSVDPLVQALKRTKLLDQAFEYIEDAAVGRTRAFAGHLQDADPGVRSSLADALGLSGDPAAISILQPLTEDTDPGTAQAARRAVARLQPDAASR